jgi:DNA-binding MarR family transcriptional regulator
MTTLREMPCQELARRSMITPQSMNQVVAALERRGLIEREPDPAHQRILRTTLTSAGVELLDELSDMATALEEEILADLAPEQREALIEGLRACMRRLAAGLDSHHRSQPPTAPRGLGTLTGRV